MAGEFYNIVIQAIKSIPKGKVATYKQIAMLAGNEKASRQVSYILHSSSGKYNLPWHRVINSKGRISLKKGSGYEIQKELLINEGIEFDISDSINLNKFQWETGLL